MQSTMPANLHHQALAGRSAVPSVAHCQRHCNFSQRKHSQPHHRRRALRKQCCAEQQSNACSASHKPECCWSHQVHSPLLLHSARVTHDSLFAHIKTPWWRSRFARNTPPTCLCSCCTTHAAFMKAMQSISNMCIHVYNVSQPPACCR